MTEKQFNEITDWQDRQFRTSSAVSKSKHLKEEIAELDEALKDGTPQHKIAFEIADCLFLLMGIAHKRGMSYQDVCNALDVKFKINTTRKWGAPDADGMSKHVEEIKPYPLIDDHRKHYVHYPVQNKNLKWVAVDVYLPSGHSNPDANPARREFENFADCMNGCNIHNAFHGWSEKEANNIISKSMGN